MIYPTINELTKGEFNRYELALATAKCARIITDEYVRQREIAEKEAADNKEAGRNLIAKINKLAFFYKETHYLFEKSEPRFSRIFKSALVFHNILLKTQTITLLNLKSSNGMITYLSLFVNLCAWSADKPSCRVPLFISGCCAEGSVFLV